LIIHLPPSYTDDVWARIGPSTVAFIDISKHQGALIGSGTFVSFKGIPGILTCAHVLAAVNRFQRFGLLCFAVRDDTDQRLVVDRNSTVSIVMDNPAWNTLGPDIGFMKLPLQTANALERLATLVDGDRHRELVMTKFPNDVLPVAHLAGAVEEFSRATTINGNTITSRIEGFVCQGEISRESDHAGMDRIRFVPQITAPRNVPASYGGMSGGGLWQVFVSDPEYKIVQVRLSGVAYFEEAGVSHMEIICHGPQSVYTRLYPQI
jgi:hypothetical protein